MAATASETKASEQVEPQGREEANIGSVLEQGSPEALALHTPPCERSVCVSGSEGPLPIK